MQYIISLGRSLPSGNKTCHNTRRLFVKHFFDTERNIDTGCIFFNSSHPLVLLVPSNRMSPRLRCRQFSQRFQLCFFGINLSQESLYCIHNLTEEGTRTHCCFIQDHINVDSMKKIFGCIFFWNLVHLGLTGFFGGSSFVH